MAVGVAPGGGLLQAIRAEKARRRASGETGRSTPPPRQRRYRTDLWRGIVGDTGAGLRIPCRISTDWTIIAGTSNWGGYALAAAVLLLRDAVDALDEWDAAQQLAVLTHIIEHGPAVDGCTARREATVDGLPFATYIQPWEGIRRLLGLG